ncbi:MAG TPA: hypothetical protein VG146_12520 [Verrucomicrobiae bacterium]|nr:hypothetical protein [Verrucomicrobiae bacterium]
MSNQVYISLESSTNLVSWTDATNGVMADRTSRGSSAFALENPTDQYQLRD